MSADTAIDTGQGIGQPRKAARLSDLAHLFPVRMIAVLQPAFGIAADRLEMGGRILRIQHVPISRRHGELSEPSKRRVVFDALSVRSEIDPAPPAASPSN